MTQAIVVDDNPMLVLHATDILEEAGFSTFAAYSAEQALAILELHGHAIALLFTDVEMPGLDGFALARITAERWPDIGILVASGARSPGPNDMPEGATFIGKPFSERIVHARLMEILPPERRPKPLLEIAG